MKNIKYIADHRDSFGRVAYDKFISFMYEPEFGNCGRIQY